MEGRCCDVNGCNMSITDDFGLDIALSPTSSLASSAMMYCVSDYLSLYLPKVHTSRDNVLSRSILGLMTLLPIFVSFFVSLRL